MNSVIRYLESAARRYPERPAAEYAEELIDYAGLRELALRVGTGLLGLGGGEPALIYLPRGIPVLASFYGALYSARAYVPVDYGEAGARAEKIISGFPNSPIITDGGGRARLGAWGVEDSRVLDYAALAGTEPDESAALAAVACVTDSDPVYIMHTSGSTGTPKGVVVPHRAVVDFTDWAVEAFRLTERSVVGLQSPFHFDASVFDLYSCLKSGAKLQIMPEALFNFPGKIPEYLAEKHVTCIYWVPSLMISMANSGLLGEIPLPELETITFVGEIMPNKQLNVWRGAFPDRLYMNLYGPTETTCASTFYVVDREFADSEPLPVGVPCANTRVLILREDGGQAEPGEKGEICILGSGLALGYRNLPEQTAAAFVQNPLCGSYMERMYRTGDLGYIDGSGLLMYLGRMDSQIKAGGVRVELGEVEAAARCVPGVRDACALFDAARQEIVLFAEADGELRLRHFCRQMRDYAPAYMLPKRLITLQGLPKTRNGKTDRVLLKKEYNL